MECFRENRLPTKPKWLQTNKRWRKWTKADETRMMEEITRAVNFSLGLDRQQYPTATVQRKKLKRIRQLARDLLLEFEGGRKIRKTKSTDVPPMDRHTEYLLRRAIRLDTELVFSGKERRELLDLLELIATADATCLVVPSSSPHPARQYLLDELAVIWFRYTGSAPDGITTDPDSGEPRGRFFDWASDIFETAFKISPPRERVSEAISKLKK